ncbi:MAG: hypothetical protein L3J91_01165, partial [Thermoplasmata archaeon]|nr:hypothetical protein [Thermoplasmata archaeon]
MRKREYRRYLIPAAVLVGVLIAVPIALDPGAFFPTTPTPPPTYITANLTLGAAVGTHLASPFYSVVWHVAGLPTRSLVAEGAFFNTTPISFYRIGGEGDGYDPTTETEYLPPSSGVGAYVALHSFEVNYTWFASWCRARSPTCQWLDYLPGEVNNTQLAIHTAEWFHGVLDFVPNAWQFGNEPDRWSHYGENRSQFSTFDNATPSAMAYATMERNYHAAVAALFPTDHFIGIEASCVCDTSLITATAALNGANVSAMAYHAYPGPPTSNSPLPDFYGSLETGQNLSSASGHFRANV